MSIRAKVSLLAFFLALCGSAMVTSHLLARRMQAPAPRELYAVVNSQLAAFRAADYPGAYARAGVLVRQKFTLAQFEDMIRHQYGTMTNARRVEFGTMQMGRRSAALQVYFFDENDFVQPYIYTLVAEAGGWKIEGVRELRSFPSGRRLAGLHA